MGKKRGKALELNRMPPRRGSVILTEKEQRRLEKKQLMIAAGVLTAMAAELAAGSPRVATAARELMAQTLKAVRMP